ncbi:TIGR01620 family protein [Vibrio sp. 99-8-1]|uniref:YcjF family protein n=1 Tax=Vibrio sp. 99-8-1 TaxID=2607602 RepID=UPI0014939787|nr:TIGR01620 family protein [Vibrio sp. 99-8-1]NOI65517.1 TIGR01620 family protein [Vibrio sp. 99-8-1]
MSELKSKQVFQQPLNSEQEAKQVTDDDLTLQQAFEPTAKFVPVEMEQVDEEGEHEQNLEQVIRPSKNRKWFATGVLTSFSGLVGWQAINNVVTAYQSADWLSIGWSAFIVSIAGVGISVLAKELWRLRKLRRHFTVHQESEALLNSDSVGKGTDFCEKLAKESGTIAESPHLDRWRNSVTSSHSDAEILEMYDAMVVSQQDKQAKALVAKFSTEAAALVAISPLAIADMLLVAWRNFKLIDKLADIYGIELGYWSRLQLFKLVLVNMAAAGASELATEAGVDLLSMDLAGKVSARVAQGFGVGILTARLGLKAMSLLRPMPWNRDNQVKLSEIRKALLLELKSKL